MALWGYGGVVQYPKGYVKRATELVQQNGGLYIADEVCLKGENTFDECIACSLGAKRIWSYGNSFLGL